jgi:hypothetical protein
VIRLIEVLKICCDDEGVDRTSGRRLSICEDWPMLRLRGNYLGREDRIKRHTREWQFLICTGERGRAANPRPEYHRERRLENSGSRFR